MKRFATAAIVLSLGLMALPASASADTCASGASQAICQQLAECYTAGAVVLLQAPAEAVTFYRNCVFLDRRHRFEEHSTESHAHRRARVMPRSQSEFQGLYCAAQENAGNRTDPSCRVTDTRRRRSGRGGGGGGGRTPVPEPRFTG